MFLKVAEVEVSLSSTGQFGFWPKSFSTLIWISLVQRRILPLSYVRHYYLFWLPKFRKIMILIYIIVCALVFQLSQYISSPRRPICRASLGSSDWPSISQWAALNSSVSGRLLKPPPPGAACHPNQPTYHAAECSVVLNGWYSPPLHTENPH